MTRKIVTRYVRTIGIWEADYDDPEGIRGVGISEGRGSRWDD